MTLLNVVADAKDILSIESVSVLGLLLLIIFALVYDRHKTKESHKEEIKELNLIIKDKDEKISSFLEKFYVMSTKIYGFIKGNKDV